MRYSENSHLLVNERTWLDVVSDIGALPFRISEIKQINKELPLKTLSFKYNIQGKEVYSCGNKHIALIHQEYLISANNQLCEVFINQKENVDKGLCVDINVEVLSEGLNALLHPNTIDANYPQVNYFMNDIFFNKFQSDKCFDLYIQTLFHRIKEENMSINQSLNYDFIQQFLKHQLPYIAFFHSIPVLKESTKKHLFDKMLSARNLLNDSLYTSVPIDYIAQEVHLSSFRFHHLFKDTFGTSPYQYLLGIKMTEAQKLYQTGKYNWTEIADLLQFADIASFSKFYKKYFGKSPSKFQ